MRKREGLVVVECRTSGFALEVEYVSHYSSFTIFLECQRLQLSVTEPGRRRKVVKFSLHKFSITYLIVIPNSSYFNVLFTNVIKTVTILNTMKNKFAVW